MQAGRMADALVIGHMGQGKHLVRAQNEYMRRQPRPYMRVVKAVMDNDLLSALLAGHLSPLWKAQCASQRQHIDVFWG